MFQSFTGSSRRPRQVNLSGRTPNPFAAVSSIRPPAGGPAAQNTLAVAQQERLARQQERDRLNAARQLQRTWRGHKSRRETHRIWRTEWDISEQQRQGRALDFRETVDNGDYPRPLAQPYLSETDCWMQLKLLLHFFDIRNQSDIMRLIYLSGSLQSTLESHASISDGWAIPLVRLGDLVLRILSVRQPLSLSSHVCADLLELLNFLSRTVPDRMRQYSNRLYKLLAGITTDPNLNSTAVGVSRLSLIENVLAPLQPLNNQTPAAYRDFAMEYLTTPGILVALGDVEGLAAGLNYMLLFKSIIPQLRDSSSHKGRSALDGESRLWLLASLIYFHRYAHGSYETKYSSEPDFIEVVSILLSAVANDVAHRIDLDDKVQNGATDIYPSRRPHLKPLPNFVRQEVLSLLEQNSIKSLLAGMTTTPQSGMGAISNPASSTAADAKVLASYALTLLRVFHKHGNDIRLWLFLGSVSAQGTNSQSPMSAVKYFWAATAATTAFHAIVRDHRAVLDLLKPNAADVNGPLSKPDQDGALASQDWRVILIFLELYTYVLQVMDDEEFLSGGGPLSSLGPDSTNVLRQSALPLEDVQRLTVFLKNLAFSLYWNGASLIDSEGADEDDSIRSYFSPPKTPVTPRGRSSLGRKSNAEEFSDFVGVSVEDMKGLVTGVLRMIYERE
jgi:ubiquitin-protein ligase E3 C